MLDYLKDITTNWVTTLIISIVGIVGLIIGIMSYIASKKGAKFAYQMNSIRILGSKLEMVPSDLSITYQEIPVNRLTRTLVVLWNQGNTTLHGVNNVIQDPLRIELEKNEDEDDNRILMARIINETRSVNSFSVNLKDESRVLCTFDYLDPGDGVLVELLHTGKELYPKCKGSLKGLPEGISDFGHASLIRTAKKNRFLSFKLYWWLQILFGSFLFYLGIDYDKVSSGWFYNELNKWLGVFLGIVFIVSSLIVLISSRRKAPKKLLFDRFVNSDNNEK